MGFFPRRQKSEIDLQGTVKLGGVALTADASELNVLNGVTASTAELNVLDGVTASTAELNLADKQVQTLVADGAITVKNGVCIISKTVPGVVAATLADPTAGTDDFKMLTILNGTAHASTVTAAGQFGGGGAGEDVATFSGAVGDSLTLLAYNGKWYIVGSHQCTIA